MKNVALVPHPEARVTTACVATAILILTLCTLYTEVAVQVILDEGPVWPRAVPQTASVFPRGRFLLYGTVTEYRQHVGDDTGLTRDVLVYVDVVVFVIVVAMLLMLLLLFLCPFSLTSQQHTSVSQERICSDSCARCQTEIEVAEQAFFLTQSRYIDNWAIIPVPIQSGQAPAKAATGIPIID